MVCPYCALRIHFNYDYPEEHSYTNSDPNDPNKIYSFYIGHCPSCERVLVIKRNGHKAKTGKAGEGTIEEDESSTDIIFPKTAIRQPLPADVPIQYVEDYNEAALLVGLSPKASAALSRRAPQRLLHEHLYIKEKNLDQEIKKLLDTGNVPSYIAEAVDAIRTVGNFAAHPIKNERTGEIADVEPGEAEWLLEVLEGLYDHYFVKPAQLKARRAALDAKLIAHGKPTLK